MTWRAGAHVNHRRSLAYQTGYSIIIASDGLSGSPVFSLTSTPDRLRL